MTVEKNSSTLSAPTTPKIDADYVFNELRLALKLAFKNTVNEFGSAGKLPNLAPDYKTKPPRDIILGSEFEASLKRDLTTVLASLPENVTREVSDKLISQKHIVSKQIVDSGLLVPVWSGMKQNGRNFLYNANRLFEPTTQTRWRGLLDRLIIKPVSVLLEGATRVLFIAPNWIADRKKIQVDELPNKAPFGKAPLTMADLKGISADKAERLEPSMLVANFIANCLKNINDIAKIDVKSTKILEVNALQPKQTAVAAKPVGQAAQPVLQPVVPAPKPVTQAAQPVLQPVNETAAPTPIASSPKILPNTLQPQPVIVAEAAPAARRTAPALVATPIDSTSPVIVAEAAPAARRTAPALVATPIEADSNSQVITATIPAGAEALAGKPINFTIRFAPPAQSKAEAIAAEQNTAASITAAMK